MKPKDNASIRTNGYRLAINIFGIEVRFLTTEAVRFPIPSNLLMGIEETENLIIFKMAPGTSMTSIICCL